MKRAVTLCIVGILAAGAHAQDHHKASTDKKPAPASVGTAIAKLLAQEAVTVASNDKEMLRFWFRASVPTTAAGGTIPYSAIPEGSLVGVVEVLKGVEVTDFRNQVIDPGVYTLRLGSHPQDGNHMGISPFPEYLCLCPAAEDQSAEPVEHEALMELSEKSLGTGHPVVFYLEPVSSKEKGPFPAMKANALHHIVVQVKTQATLKDKKPVDLFLGIVVVGVSDAA